MAQFKNVWDALEEDPVKRENLKIRSHLMIEINAKIDEGRYIQKDLASLLSINQPRVSALRQGKINDFRLDMLVDIATRLDLHVSLAVAA